MLLGRNADDFRKESAIFTATEIHQQPKTWQKTLDLIRSKKGEIDLFLSSITSHPDYDIILTGAGTSEFVGNALFSYLNKTLNYKVKSYATTDITSTPQNYLSKTKPTLLISFARSGNSPESLGAVQAADVVCENLYHLFITCNKDGALSKLAASKKQCLAINLADETNDQSFAMTSSFTNMYLALLSCFHLNQLDNIEHVMESICATTETLLEKPDFIREMVNGFDFKRIVYLGSNVLKGIAQESALKMLELTAGQVTTMYDTPLGFRHGPKSVVNEETLLVVYCSDDEHTYRYEVDLIKEICVPNRNHRVCVISNHKDEQIAGLVDWYYSFENKDTLENAYLGLNYIVVAQCTALFKSLSLSLTPDNPFPGGFVNRVVKGVTLYPYTEK